MFGGERGRDEGVRTAPENEQARVDGGGRLEGHPRKPPGDTGLVERAPDDVVQRARPWQAALARNSPLDDEIRADQRRAWIVQQPMEEIGRAVEREARDDPERLVRKGYARRVALDDLDVFPAIPQTGDQARVDLDRDDSSRDAGELRGKPPASGTEVDHEVVAADACVADELRCEGRRSEEVLATRA